MQTDMRQRPGVPVIDLAPFRADPQGAGRAVVRDVDRACREIGFLVVTGHGIARAVVQAAFTAGYAFFDRPIVEKQRFAMPGGRGYAEIGRQALARSRDQMTPPDLLERFCLGAAGPPHGNQWPERPAGLRAAFEAYYRAAETLAATLMTVFATALDLPPDFFGPMIDRHISDLCLNHYPPQQATPLPGQLRAGAHTDYGSLTIVAPSAAPGGLQVLDRAGAWQDVPWVEGGFVVNLGDLMAQWTNDRWVSTMHRVANPPLAAGPAGRRLSIVFFHQPNDDAVIETIPTCIDVTNPVRYAPTTSGAHLRMKVAKHLAVSDV